MSSIPGGHHHPEPERPGLIGRLLDLLRKLDGIEYWTVQRTVDMIRGEIAYEFEAHAMLRVMAERGTWTFDEIRTLNEAADKVKENATY